MKSIVKKICILFFMSISTTSYSQQGQPTINPSRNEVYSINGHVACITPSKLLRDPNRDASQYSRDELQKHLSNLNSVISKVAADLGLAFVIQDYVLCNPDLNITDYIASIVNSKAKQSVTQDFNRPIKVVYVNASKLIAGASNDDEKNGRLKIANQILRKMYIDFKVDLILQDVAYAAKEYNITDYLLAVIKQEKADPPLILLDPPKKKIRIGYVNTQRLFKTHPGFDDLASRTDKNSREEVEKIIYRANQRLKKVAEEGNFDFILQDVVWTKNDYDLSTEVIGKF